MLGLLVLLIVWAATGGGGGDDDTKADGKNDGKNPASSITPGRPDQSGPAISERPGGRDESGDGGTSSGEGSGGADGSGEGSGDGADGAASGETSGGTTAGAGSGGAGSGERLPAGSTLPDCRVSDLELTVESEKNRYEPDEKPKLRIRAKNAAAADCKIDLGPREFVVTITKAGDDEAFWKSSDCPTTPGSLLYRVPGDSGLTSTLTWNRKPSAANCATPPPGSATPGTYLVEAKGAGTGTLRASFVLEEA